MRSEEDRVCPKVCCTFRQSIGNARLGVGEAPVRLFSRVGRIIQRDYLHSRLELKIEGDVSPRVLVASSSNYVSI